MAFETRPAITPQLVIGVFFTLLGIVLTLDRLHVVEAGHLRPLWPLFLMAVGTALLLQRRDPSGRFWGFFWTGIGGWLLLNTLGLLRVSLGELIGPLILIVIGASVISRTFRGPRPPRQPHSRAFKDFGTVPPIPEGFAGIPQSDGSGRVTLFTIMGEAKRASNDKPFRGGEMTAFMGGCVLDLRQATIPPGEQVTIDLLAVMAGHEIWVPQGWTVVTDVVPLLGGIDDKRLPAIEPPPDVPSRLRLRGFVLMGGVVLKNELSTVHCV
jgi:hypothetical protein